MRQWWHVPRYLRTQTASFSISSLRLRAPLPSPHPKPKSGSKDAVSKAVAKSRQSPIKSSQLNQKRSPDWTQAISKTAARWKSGWQTRYVEKRSLRLAVYATVASISGTTYIFFFVLERVPITGRRRFSWVPRSTLAKIKGLEGEMMAFIQENEGKLFVQSDFPGLRKIEAVFSRVIKASGLEDIAWEVRVLDAPNEDFACVFRSGLVFITTGFFYHAIGNDDELAAVIGHEVAHVIARHNLETNSIELAETFFTKPFAWLALLRWIFPEAMVCLIPIMASSTGKLYLSRKREREADYIGLLLMADAGFDASGAVTFWTKVTEWEEEQQRRGKKGSRKMPQFQSTHPHSASRIKQIGKWIPEIHNIIGSSSSGTDHAITQSRRVVATKRRWEEFAVERDMSRRLIEEEVQKHRVT